MRRVSNYALAALFVLSLIVAGILASPPGPTSSSTASTTTTSASSAPQTFYLDIGGSASLGTQPTGVATDNGHRTLNGYANDVVMIERMKGVSLTLYHVGCPGETVQSMLDKVTSDRCYAPPSTQLSRAVRYLTRHHDEAGVVSIDLGLNNVRPCISHLSVGEPCVAQQIGLVTKDLPTILKVLKNAAGPHVRLIGFEYDDPFLARYLDGSGGPALAYQTLLAMDRFNAALHEVYSAAHVPIANIPAAFKNDDDTPVTLDNVGSAPENVNEICELTWMCQPPPFGPDDHPNNEGYMAIAEAVTAELPKSHW